MLETKRLLLRPWRETDAEELFRYAQDPQIGPMCGWEAHRSVEESAELLRTVLAEPETYAVVLKSTDLPVGSLSLRIGKSRVAQSEQEGEIGYWLGVPYWGQGLIPEAVEELLRYGFEERQLEVIWCSAFEGNEKSRRVQEKCGFRYHHTIENAPCLIKGVFHTLHVTRLSREEWLASRNGAM